MLIQSMEEYANWGFHFMEDKLTDDPNYFFRETAFLEVFLAFDAGIDNNEGEEEPELYCLQKVDTENNFH